MTELQEITQGKSLLELVREFKYQLEEMGETLFSPICSQIRDVIERQSGSLMKEAESVYLRDEAIRAEIKAVMLRGHQAESAWLEDNPNLPYALIVASTSLGFLTDAERQKLHDLKMSLSSGGLLAEAAAKRTKVRRTMRDLGWLIEKYSPQKVLLTQ